MSEHSYTPMEQLIADMAPEGTTHEQIQRKAEIHEMLRERYLVITELRGEQPDSLAMPNAGALRGDTPLSRTERSEV